MQADWKQAEDAERAAQARWHGGGGRVGRSGAELHRRRRALAPRPVPRTAQRPAAAHRRPHPQPQPHPRGPVFLSMFESMAMAPSVGA
eukprot:72487-Rhodomonas_salina.8